MQDPGKVEAQAGRYGFHLPGVLHVRLPRLSHGLQPVQHRRGDQDGVREPLRHALFLLSPYLPGEPTRRTYPENSLRHQPETDFSCSGGTSPSARPSEALISNSRGSEGVSGGASMAGILSSAAANRRRFSRLASLSLSSCWRRYSI